MVKSIALCHLAIITGRKTIYPKPQKKEQNDQTETDLTITEEIKQIRQNKAMELEGTIIHLQMSYVSFFFSLFLLC